MNINWPYTTIDHSIRKYSGISCESYIVADMIYHLQNNKESKFPGWFYGNRESLAEEVGVSKRTIVRIINELVEKGFIERDEITSYLRTTLNWDKMFVARGVTKLHSNGAKAARKGGDKVAPNNNIYSILINNSNENSPDFEKSVKNINSFLKKTYIEKYIKENGTEPYFTAVEAGKLKSIVKKVIFKMKEKSGKELFEVEEIKNALRFFVLASWDIGDNFIQSNFSLTTIDSKFNDIYVKIKNRSNGQNTKSKPVSRFHESAI